MEGELTKYAIFIKVVEVGNISKAAEVLNYTQSGVSHAIQALEKEIGFPLFTRGKTGVKLTPKGKTIYPEILALVNQSRRLSQVVEQMNHKVVGHIRIGAFTSVMALLLPQMISAFTEKYPGVVIDVVHGDYQEIEMGVLEGSLDCGFISGESSQRLSSVRVLSDEMKAIVGKANPIASQDNVKITELIKNPLILQSKGFAYDVEKILAPYKDQFRVRCELSDDIEVMYLVAENYGVGLVPELMLRVGQAEIKTLHLDPPVYRTINLIAPLSEHRNVVTNEFVEFLKTQTIEI